MRVSIVSVILLVSTVPLLLATPVRSQEINTVKVTLGLKNGSLINAFNEIEQQTSFRFVYHKEELESLSLRSLNTATYTVQEALTLLLNNTNLTYKQVNQNLLISPASPGLPAAEAKAGMNSRAAVGGKVTDGTGQPLPGVSVKIKGSTAGTSTDAAGNFTINASPGAVLVFSYVGFATQEVTVGSSASINVKLVEDSKSLNEVVVTALGVKKEKRSLNYSASEVKGDEFTQARENNVANALTGKIAGVDASGVASGPGGSSRVIIRGAGAINGAANNQPLYVVNGLPINNNNGGASANAGGFNFDRGDGISSINPDDIETITVLKSGAAAALYGSQAANGVILITTKSGKAQQGVGVEFNSNLTYGTPSSYPNYQYEYGSGDQGKKPTDMNSAISSGRLSYGARIDGSPVVQFDGVARPYSAVSVKDNINNFYRPSRDLTNTLAFTGGSNALNFRLSVSDLNAQAQTPNSSFDRKTSNLAVRSNLGKNNLIQIEGNAQYNLEKGHNRPTIGYAEMNPAWATYLLGNTVDIRSLAPGYDANGNEIQWNPVPAAPNPWYVVNKVGNDDKKNRFIGSGSVKINILKNLFVKGTIARDFQFVDRSDYVPIGSAYTPRGYYDSYQNQDDLTNMLATINYNATFLKDFSVNILGGAQQEKRRGIASEIRGKDFIIPDYISYRNLATLNQPYEGESHSGTNSLFVSADLDYKKIFYLSLTGRKDWFSTLNVGYNGIFYPSIGGSVILSDAVKLPDAISYLKLRGSWAQVGSATINPFQINQTYGITTGGFNGIPVQTAPNSLLDPNLRPLLVTTSEGGFEIQFLNNRLGLDATYYNRLSTNNIISPDISTTTGYAAGPQNVGTLRNRGVELLLTGTPVKSSSGFNWDASFNFAYNQSDIISLSPGLSSLTIGNSIQGSVDIITQVGLPYGTVRGLVFQKDANGNQIFNRTSGYEQSIMTNLGVANPPYTMGFSNNFRYKKFSLNVLLDAKFGAVGYSNLWYYASRFGLTKETLPGRETGIQLTGVDETGAPFSKLIPADQQQQYYNNRGANYPGSVEVFNTDFVKLRSLIFTYSVPVEKLKFVKLQGLSLSLVARNLAILYRDKRVREAGLDPEFGQTVGNTTGTGGIGEPRTRNIGLSLNVKF